MTKIQFSLDEMPKPRKKLLPQRSKEDFICNVCKKSLSSSYNLRVHTQTNCSTSKNHSCEICDKSFLTAHSLKTHQSSLHFGDKTFVCAHCAKTFLSKGQLKVHERSHTKEKAFHCEVSSLFCIFGMYACEVGKIFIVVFREIKLNQFSQFISGLRQGIQSP
jgi:uncharacterized Zn-finger protein